MDSQYEGFDFLMHGIEMKISNNPNNNSVIGVSPAPVKINMLSDGRIQSHNFQSFFIDDKRIGCIGGVLF